jgi:integrase
MVCMSSRSASTSATDSRQAMRGSIEKYSTTAGDRWRVRYELPPDPDGRRRQRTKRGFLRQRDAERALRDAIGSVQDGTYVEPSQDTVAPWLDEWLERRRPIDASAARRHRGKLAPSTWAQYRTYIDSMIVPVIGDIRLRDLQPEDLERLYDTLERTGGRNGTGHAPKTIVNAHGILSSALTSAVKRGKIPVSPTTRLEHPPTVERQRAAWWSAEQLRAFLHHVESDRLYAAWLLFATTGMRRGEVAGLTWDDIDLDACRVTVHWQLGLVGSKPTFKPRPKSDAGRRRMSLDPYTLAALREHRRRQLEERLAAGSAWCDTQTDHYGTTRTGLVFVWPDGTLINPERFTRWFTTHVEGADLPRIRLHDVRHSYASAGLANAAGWAEVKVISERLGHASIGITLDTFSHVLPDRDAEVAATLATAILGE